MGIATALRTRLQAVSGVTDLVSTRVYQGWAPTSATYPYITLTQISGPPQHHLGGAADIANVQYQVDVWSDSGSERDSVADEVRKALDGWNGTSATVSVRNIMLNEASNTEEEPEDASEVPVFRARIDADIWYARTAPSF